MWPWAVVQCEWANYFLAMTAYAPPQSPRDFSAGLGAEPADVGWARVLFCDVYVALPMPDF